MSKVITLPHQPSLQLFREALRTVRQHHGMGSPTPTVKARLDPHKRKLAYNVRGIFEIYRDVRKPQEVEKLIQEGRHDLQLMQALVKAQELGLSRENPASVQELLQIEKN
ncbi:hypothetical protein HDU85_000648 [Gaertneriomyces sp. JEL0708]|nr:hypothetical protein HDU85_000648 [Gaertneriomyces sp. JEL0708]